MTTFPFWIDHDGDRSAASDGVSRYGHYVRDRIRRGFEECWDGTYESLLDERFAALAFRTATGPVMAPGYASWDAPVMSVNLTVDGESMTPGLAVTVEIATTWPRAVSLSGPWQRWPREHSLAAGDYPRSPYSDEVTKGGYYALASLQLVFPVSAAALPAAPGADHHPGEVEDTARRAVRALVTELNRVVEPVITELHAVSSW